MNTLLLSQYDDLASWLAHLERLHRQEIDLGLGRVAIVAQRLCLPLTSTARDAQAVIFAGTNGKGSTLAFSQALALAQGWRVGSYTSPHFIRFNERIQLDGQPVSDQQLCAAFAQIEQARLTPTPISLSYFEFATLAALVIFSQQDLHLWLLEVGLGGRLDAVNLVDADVAVITTVDLDHQDFLGNTREAIGSEKAGIFRPRQQVVLGSRDMPSSVHHHAQTLACQVDQLGRDFDHQSLSAAKTLSWHWWSTIGGRVSGLPLTHLPLDNLATALQVMHRLDQCALTPAQLKAVIQHTQLTGRMQRIGRWVLDVAHNPHAAGYLAERLSQQGPVKRLALIGLMADKDRQGILAALMPWVSAWVTTDLPTARALSAQDLATAVREAGGEVLACFTDSTGQQVHTWLHAALADYDEVLVVGSFFTVAQQLAWLDTEISPPCVMA